MKNNYWRVYHDETVAQRSDQLREECEIHSTGVPIHMDVYPHPDPGAPVVIFNHGAAGYCRLFVALALSYHERGYTVVLPDQRGQGFSGGGRGDYTISECVQNVVDAAHWARKRFGTPVFMAGGSVGGALTYYAAAAGAPVRAITCLNLFDFGNGTDGLGVSRLGSLARYRPMVSVLKAGMALVKPLPWPKIPFKWLGVFEKLMDERDALFQSQWDADPVPPRLVTFRSLESNLSSSPAIPFEENQVPTLVINQSLDRMVDPKITRHNYEQLAGPKRYLELPFGHWSSQPEFWKTMMQSSDAWFREHM